MSPESIFGRLAMGSLGAALLACASFDIAETIDEARIPDTTVIHAADIQPIGAYADNSGVTLGEQERQLGKHAAFAVGELVLGGTLLLIAFRRSTPNNTPQLTRTRGVRTSS